MMYLYGQSDNYKKYRTVVYLTHQQRAGLEQLVRESEASLAELLRRATDKYLEHMDGVRERAEGWKREIEQARADRQKRRAAK